MAQALVVTKLAYEHEVWDVYIGIGNVYIRVRLEDVMQEWLPLAVVGGIPC